MTHHSPVSAQQALAALRAVGYEIVSPQALPQPAPRIKSEGPCLVFEGARVPLKNLPEATRRSLCAAGYILQQPPRLVAAEPDDAPAAPPGPARSRTGKSIHLYFNGASNDEGRAPSVFIPAKGNLTTSAAQGLEAAAKIKLLPDDEEPVSGAPQSDTAFAPAPV